MRCQARRVIQHPRRERLQRPLGQFDRFGQDEAEVFRDGLARRPGCDQPPLLELRVDVKTRHQRDTQARERRFDQHRMKIVARANRRIAQHDAGLLRIGLPRVRVLPPVKAWQCIQRRVRPGVRQQRRTAHGHQHFLQQRMQMHSSPCRMLEMDGGVETAPGQQERFHALGDMDRDVRVPVLKVFQPGDQPARGEGRNGGDIDARAFDGLPHQIQAVPFQPIQNLANLHRVPRTVRCQPYPVADPLEQRDTQERLQPADLTADGALGSGEFIGGSGKAAVSGRGFECLQRGIARDLAGHAWLAGQGGFDVSLSKYH
ncbi:hypothetical protein BC2230_30537 [Burkholderia cepacia]